MALAIGAAIMASAGTIVTYVAGATIAAGSFAYYVAVAAVTYIGSSIMGSASAPEPPDTVSVDSYSGTKLQNQKSNTSAVPICYGKNRIGGNIIWQGTRGTSNNDLHQIIVFSGGDNNSILEYYAGKELLTSIGSNGVFHTADGYVQTLGYVNKPTTINAPSDNAGNISSLATLFPNANLDALIPSNVSFIVTRQVFNNPNHTQANVINVILEGQKVQTLQDSNTLSTTQAYSNNPAEITLDLMLNELNINQNEIDISEFYNAKVKCDAYGYSCNVIFNQQVNIQSCIRDVISTCRGQIVYSQGLWKFKLDEKQKTTSLVLTEDDTVNKSLNISMKGFSDIANNIQVKYVNPNDEWLSAMVNYKDDALVLSDGQEIIKTLDIKGVTNTAQANKLSEITLNTMRYTEDASGNRINQTPIAIGFSTTVKNANLEVGDLIELQHSLLDRDRKFIVLSVDNDQSGAIQISAREYCETHFKNANGVYLI